MKKRVFPLLCALALLLAGCTTVPPGNTEKATAETAAVSVTAAPATEAPAEMPTELQFSGSVTAGGVLVHTDSSAYQPYAGAKAQYTRLREGILDSFEPSPDYGAVYPYAAARIFTDTEDGYSWDNGTRWGFVDRGGRILTDGIYNRAYAMYYSGAEYDNWGGYQPFWVVSQIKGTTVHTWEEGEYSGSWVEADIRYGVISMDGSFALDCAFQSIQALQKGFYCVEDWETKRFSVYDDEGKRLFGNQELLGDLKVAWYKLEYGDGLYCLNLCLETGTEGVYEYRCQYYDDTGAPVLGTYQSGGIFQDGLACASLDGKYYGYIDKTGAWVIGRNYTGNDFFRDGLVIQTTAMDRSVLLDTQGEVLLEAPLGGWISLDQAGFRVNRGEAEGYAVDFYDRTGKLLISGNETVYSLDRETLCYTSWDEGKTYLIRPATGEELKLHQLDYIEPGITVRDGEVSYGYIGHRYNQDLYTFILGDLSGSGTVKDGQLPNQNVYSTYQTRKDPVSAETWYLYWTGTGWEGLSESGRRLTLPLRSDCPRPYGDMVYAQTDQACCLAELSGEIVFRYPLNAED